jgi:hypothetical protein
VHPDEVRVGFLERLAHDVGERGFVHAVGAAREHQQRRAAPAKREHERFHDLSHLAADAGRRLRRRARRAGQMAETALAAERGERVLDALRTRAQRLQTRS